MVTRQRKTRKATFSLHTDVLDDLDKATKLSGESSKNAFVERALTKELKEARRKRRTEEWQKAAADPLFMKDIQQIERDFQFADDEASRSIT